MSPWVSRDLSSLGQGFTRLQGKRLGWLAAAIAGAIAIPKVIIGVLGVIGFSTIGPVAGSIAAAIQSAIGSVTSMSLFALTQSIAMGGMFWPLLIFGVIVAVGLYLYMS